ncbi:vWA domain-containing protein [Ruixingdingia sedimenti]|uniref:VWA domain-containing protein n=1 Tax=Ruixingdingia sedimenti TaxID=3073604 RepID=A0ABU1F4W3_9RHOB|nr:VWA domain-containing protein [Xinfangfangia sp. LG-4]MDR5651911.1 VWA domain-containing protein [Xinfangfangia sp. LG-4]
MAEGPPALPIPEDGKLLHNIAHFARALRRAGLPIGPGRVREAAEAVAAAGFGRREDFYWTLHACFVSRPEQRVVFAQVFRLFWRDPRYMEHMMALLLPSVRGVAEERAAAPGARRAAEALLDAAAPDASPPQDDAARIEIDASRTASARERLRTLDFEQMSVAEAAAARRMLADLALPARPLPARRLLPQAQGRVDPRRALRAMMRRGGDIAALPRRAAPPRRPDLVVICDISGSMAAYSRMLLQFTHAVACRTGQVRGRRAGGWGRVHAFTFGTRLTNITRHLAQRDADAALTAAGAEAQDWQGGTRIGACLAAFNRDWSRRVLARGAVVVLITDGLERDDPAVLAAAMERLHLSCRRLIWVNPLLRWDGFAPRAAGVRAMLPHVDALRAGHSLASLQALAAALADPGDGGERARMLRAMAAEGAGARPGAGA